MRIYLSEDIHPDAVKKLKERAEIVSNFEHIEDLDAIILRTVCVTKEMMEQAISLKVIGKHGVGYDSIDIDAAKEMGIKVVYTPGANAQSVAELIVGLMFDISRNISRAHGLIQKSQIEKIAPSYLIGRELSGKVLGLIGMGNIAQIVGRRLMAGFDMKVIGYDPYIEKVQYERLGVEGCTSINDVLSQADFISVSVPLTVSTRHMIGTEELQRFKKDAILINASRGGVIDENALYQALSEGWIRGAASDVFIDEPPKGDNPLMTLPNFLGTPHMGANTEEAGYRVGMSVVEDVLRVLDGEKPFHPVV